MNRLERLQRVFPRAQQAVIIRIKKISAPDELSQYRSTVHTARQDSSRAERMLDEALKAQDAILIARGVLKKVADALVEDIDDREWICNDDEEYKGAIATVRVCIHWIMVHQN